MKKINNYMMRKEAAKFLGVTKTTLINWEKEKKITVYRNPNNKYRLYDREELERKRLNDHIFIQEAAELLGVSCNTLRLWEHDGKIHCYRNPINNYRMYKKEDLEKLLLDIKKSHCCGSVAQSA